MWEDAWETKSTCTNWVSAWESETTSSSNIYIEIEGVEPAGDKEEEDLPPLEIPEFPDSADLGLLWAPRQGDIQRQTTREKDRVVQKPGDRPGRH
jgi:hypothetical protein